MRLIACLFAAFALSANAQVYKWVDEKGVTQYGESPPQNAKATRVNTRAGGGSPASGKPGDAEPKADEADPKKAEERAVRCTFERQQLKVLEESGEITYKNDKGEEVALDEAKRKTATAQTRENVKRYCPPAKAE